jgi:hypothetical protein
MSEEAANRRAGGRPDRHATTEFTAKGRVLLRSEPGQGVVSGFDHFRACEVMLYVFYAWCAVGVYVLVAGGLRVTLASVAVGLICPAALAQGFRFTVTVEPSGVTLARSWLGIAYKRRTAPIANIGVEVWGTGDWGFEGDWPMGQYCEVRFQAIGEGERIGSPTTANTIAAFLEHQLSQYTVGAAR